MEMKDNEQHAFDKTVRQALENLEIPFVADHWIEMADKLAALDAEEAAFDNNLAEIGRASCRERVCYPV